MKPEVNVENLKKVYKTPIRDHGLVSSLKSLIHPVYNNVLAVEGISFKINQGEVVGFIGPNGAGKTTTLKMLTGLLHPTSGSVNVAGFNPYERKPEYLRKISMIMGNKSQLNWSITVMDSFYIIKEIYQVSDKDFKVRMDELVNLLDIGTLLPKLSRNLSLGERAKCEFAAALIYQPSILFLDEPTLGMDVSIQIKLRNFIKEYNKKYNTTIILTSHYMADITSLCSRVLLINSGKLVYDGELLNLASKIVPFKLLNITIAEDEKNDGTDILKTIACEASIINQNEQSYTIRVRKEDVSSATASLINKLQLIDLTIEDPPIEAVIDQVYREGVNI